AGKQGRVGRCAGAPPAARAAHAAGHDAAAGGRAGEHRPVHAQPPRSRQAAIGARPSARSGRRPRRQCRRPGRPPARAGPTGPRRGPPPRRDDDVAAHPSRLGRRPPCPQDPDRRGPGLPSGRAAGPRGPRLDLRPQRPPAAAAGHGRARHRAGRGRRVHHLDAALVRRRRRSRRAHHDRGAARGATAPARV
ncbi:MAG: Transcriptional regulator SCO1200, Xre-family with cupin domain, partial [uncultured Solirubrobacteraceae bacterium]